MILFFLSISLKWHTLETCSQQKTDAQRPNLLLGIFRKFFIKFWIYAELNRFHCRHMVNSGRAVTVGWNNYSTSPIRLYYQCDDFHPKKMGKPFQDQSKQIVKDPLYLCWINSAMLFSFKSEEEKKLHIKKQNAERIKKMLNMIFFIFFIT